MLRAVVALALAGLLFAPARASAQPTQKLFSQAKSGTITANGGSVEMLNTGGLGSLKVQSTGTYTGTWEVQCSVAPAGETPVYDTDDEVNLSLEGASSAAVQSVTDTVGIWSASIAGCTAVKAIGTSAFTGTLTVYMYATTTGGGSSSGGGSTTVASDGSTGSAVPASANYTGVNVAGTLRGLTGLSVGSVFPATVAIVDSSGNQISTFGGSGGTSVNEDVASADAHPGTPAYTVRNNTLTGATSTDGDYQPMKSTAAGATYTAPTFADVVAVAGNGATTTGTQRVTIANDSTGILAAVTNVATIGTSVTPGTSAAHLGKAEDAVAGSGDTGVAILGHIQGAPAATAADADYGAFKLDLLGKLWGAGAYREDDAHTTLDPLVAIGCVRRDTTPSSSSGTAADYSNCNVDANGRIYTQAVLYNSSGTELTPSTDATHDSASSATGPQTMLRATTDLDALTAVSDGDAVKVAADTLGRQITVVGCGRDNRLRGYLANTDGASTALTGMGAQGAGIIIEVYSFIVTNSSATDVTVDIRDGTAGSVLTTLPAPATTDTLGGAVINLSVPITFTANTAVAMDTSAAASTVYVTAVGCSVK